LALADLNPLVTDLPEELKALIASFESRYSG
jgi:hypothetical protein